MTERTWGIVATRLDPETGDRLSWVCDEVGLNRSKVLRVLARLWLDRVCGSRSLSELKAGLDQATGDARRAFREAVRDSIHHARKTQERQ